VIAARKKQKAMGQTFSKQNNGEKGTEADATNTSMGAHIGTGELKRQCSGRTIEGQKGYTETQERYTHDLQQVVVTHKTDGLNRTEKFPGNKRANQGKQRAKGKESVK